MIGDQQSATLGLQIAPKQIKVTYGTGCFLMQNTGPQICVKEGLLSTVLLQLGEESPAQFGLEAAVESGAAVLNFFKNDLRLIKDFKENDSLLLEKIQNRSGFFFENAELSNQEHFQGDSSQEIYESKTILIPSLNSTLFSPFWKSNIQGQILNLNFSTGRTELYASALESFCFRIKQCLDVMDLEETTDISIDGGVSQNPYLAHFQANLLQRDLKRVSGVDGTMRGVFLSLCSKIANAARISVSASSSFPRSARIVARSECAMAVSM